MKNLESINGGIIPALDGKPFIIIVAKKPINSGKRVTHNHLIILHNHDTIILQMCQKNKEYHAPKARPAVFAKRLP